MLQTLFEYNNHPTKTKNDVAIRYRGGLYCEFKKSIIFQVWELCENKLAIVSRS